MATAVAPHTQTIIPPSGTKLTLPIEGMSCASCVARVETAIRAVPGVTKVSVSLATERATITAAPDLALPAIARYQAGGLHVRSGKEPISRRALT
jgi:copper chaperone CopZ